MRNRFITPILLFSEELERRARIRARHERDERRRERAYRRAMEGPPKPDFSSEVMFPPTAALLTPPLDVPLQSPPDGASPSTSAVSPPTSGPSFAKVCILLCKIHYCNQIWTILKLFY